VTAPAPRPPSTPLLVALTAVGQVPLHVLMPVMPELGPVFGVGYGTVQWTLTGFLVGQGAAQLGLGPLSDRFGRRPVIMGSALLCLAATLLCLAATSIEMLIFGRFAQAIGGSAGLVVGRAIIRDCYATDRSASQLGYIVMASVVFAMASPIVGGVMADAWGWRSIFALLSFALLAITIWAHLTLKETNRRPLQRLNLRVLIWSYGRLLSSPAYLAYALYSAFNAAAWYAFIAAMPNVLVHTYGEPASNYGPYIAPTMAGYIMGSWVTGRFSVAWGTGRMIALGLGVSIIASSAVMAASLTGTLSSVGFFALMSLKVFGSGLSMPSATARGIGVEPSLAGAASGFIGFLQVAVGAMMTLIAGYLPHDSTVPLAAAITIAIVLSGLALPLARLGRGPAP